MAAPTARLCTAKSCHLLLIILVYVKNLDAETSLLHLRPKEVLLILENSCVFAVHENADQKTLETVAELQYAFKNEPAVVIGTVSLADFTWPSGEQLRWKNDSPRSTIENNSIVFFSKKKVDRNCLLSPGQLQRNPAAELYTSTTSLHGMIDFINSKCDTFRMGNGMLSVAGHHRQNILDNLFHPEIMSDVNVEKLLNCPKPDLSNLCKDAVSHYSMICTDPYHKEGTRMSSEQNINFDDCTSDCEQDNLSNYESEKYRRKTNSKIEMAKCEVLNSLPTKEQFFHEYLKLSKPVIFKNVTKSWSAFHKWNQRFFYETFGENNVHIKLTQGGDFEGVEKAELWEDHKTFKIPDAIYRQLSFPDLVVVRPAGVNMKFSQFLDLITLAASQPERNVSAYLEYSSIPEYMPELEQDLGTFNFIHKELQRKHLNLWLSDGNTIGRLHFDPFDNLLCQMRGRKEVIMFDPHDNRRLYEAHIPQAMLGYNEKTKTFRKKTLEDSTSMVMSPVDIRNPDLQRFKLFKDVVPLNCTIDEGDVLFMPAFWWHEVYSYPNKEEKRNLAVNFWYEPFLTKEFPCAECKLDVNPFYHHLL